MFEIGTKEHRKGKFLFMYAITMDTAHGGSWKHCYNYLEFLDLLMIMVKTRRAESPLKRR